MELKKYVGSDIKIISCVFLRNSVIMKIYLIVFVRVLCVVCAYIGILSLTYTQPLV